MKEILRLKKSNCKNCYKCIRHCPVKAIRFSAGQAHVVGEECVLCGQCFAICPQNAKQISCDMEKVRVLLMTSPVYVSIAPSFAAAFPGVGIDALREAEAYPGPSLIIAYAPCINHGIKAGMDQAQAEMKRAVDAGYWPLYRYNPAKESGKFTLDSKEPSLDFQEFLEGEVRYASLHKTFPGNAETLFKQAEQEAKARYESYKKLAQQD